MQALDRRTVLVGASAILPATGLMKRGTGEGVTKSLKRTVTVKGVTIGSGQPKIIVSITETTSAKALARARQLSTLAAIDIIELRIDHLDNPIDGEAIAALCAAVAHTLNGKPLLATFRTKTEGGNASINAVAYADLYAVIVRSGQVDLIDIELMRVTDPVRQLMEDAQSAGVAIILSNHDFVDTPPASEMISRLRRMQDFDADVIKFAVMPRDAGDLLRLLGVTWEMHSHYADRPMITMSMNGIGAVSRVSGEVFGSAATFGSAGASSAPGQIEIKDLGEVLRVMHAALNHT